MSDQVLESSADVVVIGGGIIGSATAYYLAKRNAKVILLEKGSIGNAQSSRAWGFVRQQGRDPAELPLVMEANKMWPALSQELETDIEWVQKGILTVTADEEQLHQYEAWLSSVKDFGLDTRMISGREANEMIPDMDGAWVGGMHTPSDGHAEPTKAATAFAKAAIALGASVYEYCSAQSIEVAAGRVCGIVTDRGTIKTSTVVCAAGAWSTQIARTVHLSLPQLSVLSTAAETEPVRAISGLAVTTPGFSFRQRPNGRIYIGGGPRGDVDLTLDSFRYARYFLPNYIKNRRALKIRPGKRLIKDVWNSVGRVTAGKHPDFAQPGNNEPRPGFKRTESAQASFKKLLPSLGDVQIRRVWGGYIDSTPDALPVLGEASGVEGFILATGFSGHGFAMGPIVGRLMSELVCDGETSVDIRQLSYDRFRQGRIGKPKSLI